MKKCIRQELLYGIKSKTYYKAVLLLSLFYCTIIFMNYNAVKSSYHSYSKYVQYYQANNLDIEDALSSNDYSVENSGKKQTITNPLLYYKLSVEKYLYTASPKYLTFQLLESSLLFFPIVFGILGAIIGTNDYKFKTLKIKTIRSTKIKYSLSNQLALFIASGGIIILALIISSLIGFLVYEQLCNLVPKGNFIFEYPVEQTTFIFKLIVAYFIAVLFAELGYFWGAALKNVIAGLAFIVIHMLLIPNLGKYDLKNCLYFLFHKTFRLCGIVSVQEPKCTSWSVSLLILCVTFVLTFSLNLYVVKKRSSYNC